MSLELKKVKELNNILWLIKLRWIAAVCLIIAITAVKQIFNIPLHYFVIYGIALFLIFENVALLSLLKWKVKKDKINILSISNKIINAQISIDFLVLTAILHYTGGVENPFIIYYVFHMVLASILLNIVNTYLQTSFALILVGLLTFLEYFEIIPHYGLNGFIEPYLYKNGLYLIVTGFIFVTTSYLVVYLTNSVTWQLKKQKEEYIQANIQLKQKDIIKNEYILRLNHNIRVHLATILSNLNVVTTGVTGEIDEKLSKFINVAYSRTVQLADFVNDLLKLTKLRLDNKLEKQKFLFADVVKKVLDTVKDTADEKSISLTSSLDTSVGNFYGCRFSIEELLTNLLLNAVKFTPDKGKVEINVKDRAYNVLIEITDTGIGIPKGELEKIFDDFYRATNVKDNIDGTGVGLTIVKQIVNRHNGKIWVESEKSKGTKFSILLPKLNYKQI